MHNHSKHSVKIVNNAVNPDFFQQQLFYVGDLGYNYMILDPIKLLTVVTRHQQKSLQVSENKLNINFFEFFLPTVSLHEY